MLVVTEAQEDELRAFCSLVSRRRPAGNELAWALRRFEMGCERELESEALSDYMLALRALLEPEGSPRGVLAGRLAALCALPERRGELAAVVARALDLEHDVIAGEAAQNAAAEELVRRIGDHLRALLRDVICGHLDADLAVLADQLLLDEQWSDAPAEPEPSTAYESAWEDAGEAEYEPGAPARPAPVRGPVRMGRDPMPVADEIDDDQLRLIGMHG